MISDTSHSLQEHASRSQGPRPPQHGERSAPLFSQAWRARRHLRASEPAAAHTARGMARRPGRAGPSSPGPQPSRAALGDRRLEIARRRRQRRTPQGLARRHCRIHLSSLAPEGLPCRKSPGQNWVLLGSHQELCGEGLEGTRLNTGLPGRRLVRQKITLVQFHR